MKSLKVQVGDVLILKTRTKEKVSKKSQQVVFEESEWDVIKVNKKSITLQNYPTYERRTIRFKK